VSIAKSSHRKKRIASSSKEEKRRLFWQRRGAPTSQETEGAPVSLRKRRHTSTVIGTPVSEKKGSRKIFGKEKKALEKGSTDYEEKAQFFLKGGEKGHYFCKEGRGIILSGSNRMCACYGNEEKAHLSQQETKCANGQAGNPRLL
jgi:hypothetical protein